MKAKIKKITQLILSASLILGMAMALPVNAEDDFKANVGVSPMNESIILNPGDVYKGSFSVSNPGYGEEDINYYTEVGPFYVNEDYDPLYENFDGTGEIADWITVTSGATGTLKPNDVAPIEFEINVPETAPAGGQYAVISVVVEVSSADGESGSINIGESMSIGHIILAEITGESVSSGEVTDMGIQSFVIGGNITAFSTVKNTGNVHGRAVYGMKVYPWFSDQPVYSNEDMKEEHYILPDRQYQNESVWTETPMVGVFNVQYTVEFMGNTSEVTRMVIVCPWWLIALFAMGLILMILRIATLMKLSKKKKADQLID